jgi:hypothetical protein
MDSQLDDLAAQLRRLIRATVEEYAQVPSLDDDDLFASCRSNLERALLELSGQIGPDADVFSPQRATGQRRAQQGLSLEGLLHAYRLGGRVLWEGFVATARNRPGTHYERLLDEATSVWDVIDRHSAVVAAAYRDEQARLQRRTQRRRQALLDALVQGGGSDPDVARSAAAILGMPVRGPKLVVAGAYDPPGAEPLHAPEEALAVAGFVSAWQVRAGREIGLVALGTADAERAIEVLRGVTTGPVAVSPVVHGFDELASAYQLADIALRTIAPDAHGLVKLADRLPQALLVSSPDVAAIIVSDTLDGLLRLRPSERDALVDTIEALLDCDASPTHAAELLHCHRNTVIKRQQRIEALTGRRLGRPADRLHLHLAVLGLRTLGLPRSDGPAAAPVS